MNIQTVLVPVDFSTCSLLAVRQAASLAARLGAKVVVLHVSELPSEIPPGAHVKTEGREKTAADYLMDEAERQLAPFADAARELGASSSAQARLGPVVATILAAASDLHADLLVLSTHGRSGLARVMLGSVAEAVAHKAHVPVMLVRREARPECARANCEWCPHDGRSAAEARLAAESQG